MNNQIAQLEQRLALRERDLSASLEQCRLAGKLELARLQGIHDQVGITSLTNHHMEQYETTRIV